MSFFHTHTHAHTHRHTLYPSLPLLPVCLLLLMLNGVWWNAVGHSKSPVNGTLASTTAIRNDVCRRNSLYDPLDICLDLFVCPCLVLSVSVLKALALHNISQPFPIYFPPFPSFLPSFLPSLGLSVSTIINGSYVSGLRLVPRLDPPVASSM